MENMGIFAKLIVVVYIAFRYAGTQTTGAIPVVLSVLVYLALSISVYIVRKNRWKTGLLVLSILLVLGSFYLLNSIFMLLLPFGLIELVHRWSRTAWAPAVAVAVLLLFLDTSMAADYFLISAFSYLTHLSVESEHKRLLLYIRQNDEMRMKIHQLSSKLNKDEEYEQRIKHSSQLEERNKIAQEIHDRLGHSISGSVMQLEAAKLLLEHEPEKSKDMVQRVIDVLREGMESIRSTLRNIKPAPEQLGISRVKLLLDDYAATNNIQSTFVHTGDLELISPIQWKVIHDNVGEALTNSAKYAQSTSVSVRIEVLNKFIKAEVRDNGLGAATIKKGLGIAGMEERSGNLGGKMIIDGTKGFSVITLLPVEGGDYAGKVAYSR